MGLFWIHDEKLTVHFFKRMQDDFVGGERGLRADVLCCDSASAVLDDVLKDADIRK